MTHGCTTTKVLAVYDGSLEFGLQAMVTLGCDYVCLPLGGSYGSTNESPFFTPNDAFTTVSEEAIDVEALFERFHIALPPFVRHDTLSSAQRLQLLLQQADSWSSSTIGVISIEGGCYCSDGYFDALERQAQLAAYLGLVSVVLPPLGALGDSQMDRVAQWIVSFTQSQGRTRVWVSCDCSAVSWRSWCSLRRRVGRETSVVRCGHEWKCTHDGPDAVGRAVMPVVVLPSELCQSSASCCSAWLGEDVALLCVGADLFARGGMEGWQASMASWSGILDGLVVERNHREDLLHQKDGALPLAYGCSLWGAHSGMWEANHQQPGNTVSTFAFEMLRRRAAATFTLPPQRACLVDSHRILDALIDAVDQLDSASRPSRSSALLRSWLPIDSANNFVAYEDVPQIPLQPLGHHMDNSVYTTFEHDAPKYERYREAVSLFIQTECAARRREGARFVVVVLGAGRGPLITEVLNAALDEDLSVDVIAIEKNPSAASFLNLRNATDAWWSTMKQMCDHTVHVVEGDGRHLSSILQRYPVIVPLMRQCGLVVSELLGSGGDNELSPECIEGFRRELCRLQQNGSTTTTLVPSIPQSYTLHVAALQSSHLVDQVTESSRRGVTPSPRVPRQGDCHSAVFHNPLVVHLSRALLLSKPQEVWTFRHSVERTAGKVECGSEFERDKKVNLSLLSSIECGRVDFVSGFFSCTLYASEARDWGDESSVVENKKVAKERRAVTLSTIPSEWTEKMFSWFPLALPIATPVYLDHGAGGTPSVELFLRRCVGESQSSHVHYEWKLAADGEVMNEGGWASQVLT